MQDLHYDRICRTNRSEAYLISQGEEPIARVDLHFTQSVVYGILVVEKELEEQQITELIGRIDDDLVWSADLPREDFVVSVYQGRELGMYSDPDLQGEEEEEGEEGDLDH
ncbi:MAG: hypothetical protein ACYC66_02815 [Chloroflexota bacterium]